MAGYIAVNEAMRAAEKQMQLLREAVKERAEWRTMTTMDGVQNAILDAIEQVSKDMADRIFEAVWPIVAEKLLATKGSAE